MRKDGFEVFKWGTKYKERYKATLSSGKGLYKYHFIIIIRVYTALSKGFFHSSLPGIKPMTFALLAQCTTKWALQKICTPAVIEAGLICTI